MTPRLASPALLAKQDLCILLNTAVQADFKNRDALPHVAATMDAATRRMISFIALGIGGIVLLWLMTQNIRYLNIGVIVVLAGYAIEFLGVLNPRSRVARKFREDFCKSCEIFYSENLIKTT